MITPETIENLLLEWELGELNEHEVLSEAEYLVEQLGRWPDLPEDNPASIPLEVLSNLEIMNQQLLTREDIPAMRKFLNTPNGEELKGWIDWKGYINNLDLEDRKKALQSNPFYIT